MYDTFETHLNYVEKVLVEAGRDAGKKHPFRSRSKHTRRVLKWAERLCEGRNDVDINVLYMAVIFHDIGYVTDVLEKHEAVGEGMFRAYAKEYGFDDAFIEKVAHCIGIHSEKELLKEPDKLTLEEILLMEADLLDEEGALAICWDSMACGYEGLHSYEESLTRSKSEMSKKLGTQPMVTEKAKVFWNEKLLYVQKYIAILEKDIEEWR